MDVYSDSHTDFLMTALDKVFLHITDDKYQMSLCELPMQIYKWVLDSSGSEGFVLWADLWFSGYNTDTYGVRVLRFSERP